MRDIAGKSKGGQEERAKKRRKKAPKEPKRAKKGKKKRASSSSDSSSSPSSSPSSASSSSDSDGPGGSTQERRSVPFPPSSQSLVEKKRMTWELLNSAWDLEKRPEKLQSEEAVNCYEVHELEALYRMYQEVEKNKKGGQQEMAAKDEKQLAVVFQEQKDDGKRKLHPARWCRLPLKKTKKWWKKTPTIRKKTFLSFDLEFTGSEHKIADRTLQKLHDRTTALELKNFCSENAAVNSKPQKEERRADGTLVRDLDWVTPTSVAQIQEAIVNYLCANHALWPFDLTGFSLLRILTKYRWFEHTKNTKLQITLITSFFNAVMRKNKTAAANKTCILSFRQQEEILKEVLTSNGVSTEPPLRESGSYSTKPTNQPASNSFFNQFTGAPNNAGYYTSNYNKSQRSQTGSGNSSSSNSYGQKSSTSRKQNSEQKPAVCFGYNDIAGKGDCRNEPYGDGCRRRNNNGKDVFFSHRCNAVSASGEMCFRKHRRRDHR